MLYLRWEINDSKLLAELRDDSTSQEKDEGGRAREAVQQGLVLTHRFHVRVTLNKKFDF